MYRCLYFITDRPKVNQNTAGMRRIPNGVEVVIYAILVKTDRDGYRIADKPDGVGNTVSSAK
jgi:hypothetical protein